MHHDGSSWTIKEYGTKENVYSLCQFISKTTFLFEGFNNHQHNNKYFQALNLFYRITGFLFLIFFVDRDIQCDFDNAFYEENECGWKYSQKTMTALGLGTTKRLTRNKFDNANSAPMNYFENRNTLFGEFSYH